MIVAVLRTILKILEYILAFLGVVFVGLVIFLAIFYVMG